MDQNNITENKLNSIAKMGEHIMVFYYSKTFYFTKLLKGFATTI